MKFNVTFKVSRLVPNNNLEVVMEGTIKVLADCEESAFNLVADTIILNFNASFEIDDENITPVDDENITPVANQFFEIDGEPTPVANQFFEI